MKRIIVLALVLVLFSTIIGCGEENPAETSINTTDSSGVRIEIQKVESVHVQSIYLSGMPIVGLLFHTVITNRYSDQITIRESDFFFRDIKAGFVHHESKIVFIDPTVDRFVVGQLAYHLPSLRGDAIPKLILESGQETYVGLCTSYSPGYQQGQLYLVYDGVGDDLKIPVQEKIDQAVWLDDPASATGQTKPENEDELAKIDLRNLDLTEYYPFFTVGNWWRYEVFIDGEPSPYGYEEDEIDHTLNVDGQVYFRKVRRYESRGDREEITWWTIIDGELAFTFGPPQPKDNYTTPWRRYDNFDSKEIVTVPAGTFACIRYNYHFTPIGALPGSSDTLSWDAKGIGMVKFQYGETSYRVLVDYDVK